MGEEFAALENSARLLCLAQLETLFLAILRNLPQQKPSLRKHETFSEQECIPIGCIPPACKIVLKYCTMQKVYHVEPPRYVSGICYIPYHRRA